LRRVPQIMTALLTRQSRNQEGISARTPTAPRFTVVDTISSVFTRR
jgi:hypothetical protein